MPKNDILNNKKKKKIKNETEESWKFVSFEYIDINKYKLIL